MNRMRNLPCPQCDIHRFHVKNREGKFLVVTVNENYEVVAVHAEELLDGYDLSIIYCLGCSWQGSPQSLRAGRHRH
jgi:hypothetical protein